MREKEKAAPDVEAIENGTGNQTSGQAFNLPDFQYITEAVVPQGIAERLPCGAENANSVFNGQEHFGEVL